MALIHLIWIMGSLSLPLHLEIQDKQKTLFISAIGNKKCRLRAGSYCSTGITYDFETGFMIPPILWSLTRTTCLFDLPRRQWRDSVTSVVFGGPPAHVYIGGSTTSTNFPTNSAYTGYYQRWSQGMLLFAEIDTALSGATSLVYCTYIGGNGDDIVNGIGLPHPAPFISPVLRRVPIFRRQRMFIRLLCRRPRCLLNQVASWRRQSFLFDLFGWQWE